MINRFVLCGLFWLSAFTLFTGSAVAQTGADKILGTWMSEEKNVAVEVTRKTIVLKHGLFGSAMMMIEASQWKPGSTLIILIKFLGAIRY